MYQGGRWEAIEDYPFHEVMWRNAVIFHNGNFEREFYVLKSFQVIFIILAVKERSTLSTQILLHGLIPIFTGMMLAGFNMPVAEMVL